MAAIPQIFAHRGASAVAPENTLPAFEKALELGADGIELDVQATADGALVVLHDYSLERSTTGAGLLRHRTLEQLAGIDAGIRFGSSFSGTPIPTLEQVFDLVEGRCIVNIEIKNMDWGGGSEEEPLARLIQRRGLHDQVIVSSFNPFALRKMRQLDHSIPLGMLCFPKPSRRAGQPGDWKQLVRDFQFTRLYFFLTAERYAQRLAFEAMHPFFTSIDVGLIDKARSRHQSVNAWTVNSVAEARRLAGLGVHGIITDQPDLIRKGLSTSAPGAESAKP